MPPNKMASDRTERPKDSVQRGMVRFNQLRQVDGSKKHIQATYSELHLNVRSIRTLNTSLNKQQNLGNHPAISLHSKSTRNSFPANSTSRQRVSRNSPRHVVRSNPATAMQPPTRPVNACQRKPNSRTSVATWISNLVISTRRKMKLRCSRSWSVTLTR